jgi:flagellar basal-body rod modification protein FlgD
MTTVQTTTSITPAATSSTSVTGGQSIKSQDQFLKLLVAQMQNQDPMNPMDNAQITSQMAQISTVNGIDSLNATMSNLSTSFLSGQSMQAANLIGHTVLAPATAINLSNGQAVGAVDLSGNADDVQVSIQDNLGNLVQKIDLGAQKAGTIPFTWDGSSAGGQAQADGTYKISVAATQGSATVQAGTLGAGQVQSVALNSNGATLSVSGIGSVSTSQVAQIY